MKDETLLSTKRFTVVRKTYHGQDGQEYSKETVQHPGAVAILPLLDGDRICLERVFRPAVERVMVEIPAGTCEAGETPEHTAHRELEEETGYRAEKMEALCTLFMSPGILNERMRLFVATGLTPGKQNLDKGEDVEPFICTFDEALDMVRDGEIEDAKSVAALLFYDANFRRKNGGQAPKP